MADFAAPQRAHAREAPCQQKLFHVLQQQQPGHGRGGHRGVVAGRAVDAQAPGHCHQDAYPPGQQRQQFGQVLFGDDEGHEVVDFAVAAQLVGHALQGVAVALHLVAVHKMLGDVHHIGSGGAGGQLVDVHAAREQRVEQGANFRVVHGNPKSRKQKIPPFPAGINLIYYIYLLRFKIKILFLF